MFKDYILNEKEFQTLVSLKSKKLSLLNDEIYFEFYLQVIDIVYAYLYDVMYLIFNLGRMIMIIQVKVDGLLINSLVFYLIS